MISQKRNFCSKSSVRTNNAGEAGHVVLVNTVVCASLLLWPWLPPRFQPKSIYMALFTLGLKTSCYPLCWQSEHDENVGYPVLVSERPQ